MQTSHTKTAGLQNPMSTICSNGWNRFYSAFTLLLAVMLFASAGLRAQGIAVTTAAPFSQNFEQAGWTTPSTLSPAWATAATVTDALWARNSYTSGWSSASGAYTPTGANSTTSSARFHTYNSSSGAIGELYTPILDFSAAGEKAIEFYHINTSGTDAVSIAISTDGGASWSASLLSIGTNSAWTRYVVPLGSITSNNVMVKFRATSDFGTTDIGIDEVRVFIYDPANYNFTASATGGLWSSPNTWVGNTVPPQGIPSITIPDGSVVTIDGSYAITNLTVSGILQWYGSATTLSVLNNVLINSTGKVYAFTAASTPAGAAFNVGNTFTNNGYANFAVGSSGGTINFNGTGNATLDGTGTFEGDGTYGIIRNLNFQTVGTQTINTSQTINVYGMAHTAGSLNTNGKLRIDPTRQLYGQALNTQLASVAVTNMGATITVAPVVYGAAVTPWAASTAVTVGSRLFSGNNVYLVTTAGTTTTTAPSSTTLNGTPFANGTANLLYVGTLGTLATNVPYNSTLSATTAYHFGDNLYQAVSTTATTAMPTHTSGTVGSFRWIGTVAKATVNYDATNQVVRSLTITSQGSGYPNTTSLALTFSKGTAAATGTLPTAATVLIQNAASGTTAPTSLVQKSGQTSVTGGITINSDAGAGTLSSNNPQSSTGVGSIYTTNGGNNYTNAPLVGFSGPTAINLITNAGSGYTVAPTITVSGGNLVQGTALTTSNFTITVAQGKVVSVYLNSGTTACYSTPPTLTMSAPTSGTTATLAFPTNCWPAASANIGANGQLTSFTMTNSGYGYVAVPTVGVGTTSGAAGSNGGTFSTVAGASGVLTARLAVYSVTNNYFTPSTAPVLWEDNAYVPASRKMSVLTLSGSSNYGVKFNSDLTLYATSAALAWTASSNGQYLDMNGNTLTFSYYTYTGASSTFGATNTGFKNGTLRYFSQGGSKTLSFPFPSNFSVITGTGSLATGADITEVKVSQTAKPTNGTVTGANAIATGTKSYKVETFTTGGGAGTAGTTPQVTLTYNASDSLTTTQDLTFVADAPTLNGAWNLRSDSVGASGALASSGTKSTGTAAASRGPITLASGNYYAFATPMPVVTSVSPLSVCAYSGTITISGSNFSGVTAVYINDVPVTSFFLVSNSQISAIAGAVTTGVVTVVKAGVSISGTDIVVVNNGPSAPSVSPSAATVVMGQTASLTATGAGSDFRWYNTSFGGTALASASSTYTTPAICGTSTYYAAEWDGACEGPRTPVVLTVVRPTITYTKATFCGVGGADTLTVTPSDASITYTWSNLNSSATFDGGVNTGASVIANIASTAEFKVSAVSGACSDSAFVSIGLYPLPSATVTTTAQGVCPGTAATIGSGLSAGNFTASCIATPTLLTPPASAVTLVTNKALTATSLLPAGVTVNGTSLDDNFWSNIPIGFTFNFFGVNKTTCFIGTNATVMLGTAGSTQYNFTGGFPNSGNPASTIALAARDLRWDQYADSYIKYWTEGIAPNRRFVVQFYKGQPYSYYTTGQNTAELILYETTGVIDIRIFKATQDGNMTAGTSTNKYIGLQDATKTVGATAPNCTTGAQNYWNGVLDTIATPQAWRFAPPSNYNVLWFANGTQFAAGQNVFSQNVAPLTTTLYSITYTNLTTGCTNEPRSAEVNMAVLGTVAPTGVNTTSTIDSTCSGSTFIVGLDYTGITDGLTFQWQKSTDGGATWNDITGATSTTYTTSQTVVTSYRCVIVSCGGTPEYSSPKTVYFTNSITSVTSATKCGVGSKTLTATALLLTDSIKWYATQTGGVALATGGTYNTPANVATTTVYWAEPRTENCAGVRVPDTLYVNAPPALTIDSASFAICAGASSTTVHLTAGGSDYDQISWSPSTGVTGNPVDGWVFNPSTTTSFTLNGTQSAGICLNSLTINVTVNELPVMDSASASATTVCAGSTVTLNGYSAGYASGPQTMPTGYCAGNTSTSNGDEQIFGVTVGSMVNNQTESCSSNYTDYTSSIAPIQMVAGSTVPFSVTTDECDGATYYSNGLAIYVDFNRDGTFQNTERVYNTTATTLSPNTRTGSFSVPSTLTAGLTRMRVIVLESDSKPGACASGFGEAEDYAVNLVAFSKQRSDVTYSWTPGALTGATVTVNPYETTTYTATATVNATGCASANSASVTVTTLALPASAETYGSTQCGAGIPACYATGGTNGNYRWYLSATGGTAIAGENNNTLSSYLINTTTIFYVAITDGSCESLRTPVTATVNQPDAVTAAASDVNPCRNSTINLSVTQDGTTQTYAYTWSASPSTGSGLATGSTGSSVSVMPTVAGTYVYTVTATDATLGCITTGAVTVVVKASPPITSISATPAVVCAGDSVTLAAASIDVVSDNFNIGVASDASSALSSYTSYGHYFANDNPTVINSVKVYPAGTGTLIIQLLDAAGTVVATSNTTIESGDVSTTVLKTIPVNFSIPAGTTGWRLYLPSTSAPFYRGAGSYPFGQSQSGFTMTGNTLDGNNITSGSRYYFYDWNVTTTVTNNNTNAYGWSWSSAAGNTATTKVAPMTSTQYTVTITDAGTTCTDTASVYVTVNPVPPAPSTTGSEQCGSAIPTASVSSNSGAASPTFKWYTSETGGTALQTSTSNTFTSLVTTTTTFYVSEISDAGCEGTRAAVTVSVTAPDAISLTTSGATVCMNGTATISASYSPDQNSFATFTISASPEAGSGITGAASMTVNGNGTDAYSFSPSAVGTYVYTVVANDPDKVCQSSATATITVLGLPAIDSVKASADTVCSGSAVTLNAYSIGIGSGPQTLPTGYAASNATSTADEDIYNVTLGTLNNTSDCNTTAPDAGSIKNQYSNYTASVAAPTITAGDSVTVSIQVGTCGTSNYNNKVGIFIDWNRNGVFDAADSVYVTPGATSGPNLVTKKFMVPLNAKAGLTRMRTVVVETSTGTVTPTGTYTWGETEDYALNVLGYVSVNPALTYTWNPGAINGASVTANPTSATSYTCTVTGTNGCSITSAPVTVSTFVLPEAPIATNSTQCGTGIPTASVATGGANGTFNWYAAETGGSVLFSGSTITSAVSATTTYYVAESNGQCESPRTAVTVTVTPPPAIDVTGSTTGAICLDANVTLAATSEASYTYTWSAAAGSGISGSVTGASQTVTPTAPGTYVFTVNGTDGTCATSATVSVTVNPNPIITSVAASPTTICNGAPATLTATSIAGAPGTGAIGTSSTTEFGGSVYRYGYGTGDFRHQILVKASEMTANGFVAGPLTSMAFDVSSVGSGSSNNFTISLANVSASALTTTFNTAALTTVHTSATYAAVSGLNTHNFNSGSFTWDGSSDILVNICYTVATLGGSSTVSATTPSFTGNVNLLGSAGACAATTGASTYANRPLIRFSGIRGTVITGSYNWTWNPGAVAGSTASVTPSTTTSYTATATNPTTGCSTTSSAVTVEVVAPSVTLTSSLNGATSCAGSNVTLTATPTGQGPWTYSWTANGVSVTGTSATLSVAPTVTTVYEVTAKDNCNNSTTASLTVNVNALPTVSINEAGPINICAPNTTTLTASASTTDASYQWTLNGSNIAGATASSYSAGSTGTYAVKVTDTITGCTSVASAGVVLSVTAQPSVFTFTPASPSIPYGGSISITANGGTITTLNSMILSENFDGASPTWTVSDSANSPLASSWISRTSPFTISAGGVTFNNFSTIQGGKFMMSNSDAGGSGSVTRTYLTSPSFSSVHYTSLKLDFEQVYRKSLTTEANVEVSTDGGSTWALLKNYTGNQGTITAGAQVSTASTINMNAYVNQPNLKVRFRYASSYAFYWLVDDIKIYGTRVDSSTIAWTPTDALSNTNTQTVVANPTATTTYTVSATSAAGCVRTGSVTVTVRPTGVISGADNFCLGNSATLSVAVTGNGPWSGTLSDGTSFSGSTSPISVTVTPSATTTYSIASLTDASGSSIAADLSGTATVVVRQPSLNVMTESACDSYTFNGVTYTASGSYTFEGINAAGCDSIAVLNLTITSSTTSTSSAVACGSYTWTANGQTYTASGSYTSVSGCATSILNLTISCSITMNVKAYLQGSYAGNGTMAATLYDLGLSTDATATDSIEVNLWAAATTGSATAPDYSAKAILHTDGTASVTFPGTALGGSYYVALRHRSSMETWSSSAITTSSTNSVDFSASLSAVYGDGVNDPMVNMGSGVYALYSGDVNQDGSIDLLDLINADVDASQFAFGYNATDCTGDGSSDLLDIIQIENNAGLFLFYARPY